MKIKIISENKINIAVLEDQSIIIENVQDALDLMATVQIEYDCYRLVVFKENLTEDFFELKTKLAGEILQKYTNYSFPLAIVGEFESYKSKSLHDFIYECNQGNMVLFAQNEAEAIKALSNN